MSRIKRRSPRVANGLPGLGMDSSGFNIVYQPNGNLNLSTYAVVIEADDGARGEYVALWAARMAMGQTLFLAKHLGRIRTSVNASIRSHGRGLH